MQKFLTAKLTLAVAFFLFACSGSLHGQAAAQTIKNPPAIADSTISEATNSSPCQGTPVPTAATVLYAPVVPQSVTANDLVGLNIQNTSITVSPQQFITFGQVFEAGKVQARDKLSVMMNATTSPLQMDTLATWPDGSVKLASLAMQLPSLCANAQVPALVSKVQAPPAPSLPLSLVTANPKLSVTLNFTAGSYAGSQTIDLGAALQRVLTTKPDYWLRGPLVTQARVDVPLADGKSALTSTLHITADITVFTDGTAMADVQFNNDLTTVLPQSGRINPQGPLASLVYTAVVNFEGKKVTHKVVQDQYTNWHTRVWSATAPQINVQHDIAQLQRSGATLPYDLATGVNNTLLQSYEKNILQKPDFGAPLAANGITVYMPGAGGRADIGYTTQYNTVWLLTQDPRAAQVAMAQSDTSGAIPWNYKTQAGQWLSPAEHPRVWTDGRGGPHGYTDGIAHVASGRVWTPDVAHQPNLNYVPYLMTGQRWNFDRLNAQAAYGLSSSWPGYRCPHASCNILLNGKDQLRTQAWGFRELLQAAFVAPANASNAATLRNTVKSNWTYVRSQQASLTKRQGETTGWMPGDYGSSGATAPWQQDFMTGVAAMAALVGDTDARQFLQWQRSWLSGRFVGQGMNAYDGCTYNLKVINTVNGAFYNTWTSLKAATETAGLSNGRAWKNSEGYYCALARAALAGALWVDAAPELSSALSWLETAKAPYTNQASFRNDPTFNIKLPAH